MKPGESLVDTHPHLLLQWDFEENSAVPEHFSRGSKKKVSWVCSRGHKWVAEIKSRAAGAGCSQCNKLDLLKNNNLSISNPELYQEWDFKKNTITPLQISPGSDTYVWWKCSQGHSWKSRVSNRTNGYGDCKICSAYEKSEQENPQTILPSGSRVPFFLQDAYRGRADGKDLPVTVEQSIMCSWECESGHRWEMSAPAMMRRQTCPHCEHAETNIATSHPDLALELHEDEGSPYDFTFGSNKSLRWKCNQGHEWRSRVTDRTLLGNGCPQCARRISRMEEEIYQAIHSKIEVDSVVRSSREIIAPYELDMYFPMKKIAVEVNGVYWHSEAQGKGKWYHYEKWRRCKELGIQLITVWEDDYRRNPGLVLNMLSHKLGVSDLERVPARKLHIVSVNNAIAKGFYGQNHIQGSRNGRHLGLEDSAGTLWALTTWTFYSMKNRVMLERFATSGIVQGGFTKLLKYAAEYFRGEGFDQIVTFASNEVSEGLLYQRNGFTEIAEIPPDYSYLYHGRREHKFGFRLKRFRHDPSLKFVDDMTESQLAELNGIPRIWDCGKKQFALNLKDENSVLPY